MNIMAFRMSFITGKSYAKIKLFNAINYTMYTMRSKNSI